MPQLRGDTFRAFELSSPALLDTNLHFFSVSCKQILIIVIIAHYNYYATLHSCGRLHRAFLQIIYA